MKSKSDSLITNEYKNWLSELKQKFQQAQIKASIKVNSTLLEFYWELGGNIVEKQKNAAWGTGFLQQLSKDLKEEFPEVKGFSHDNIRKIKQWYLFYSLDSNLVAACYQIDKTIETPLYKGFSDKILPLFQIP